MKILITGRGGYVGSFLSPGLEDRGHEVVGIDREDGDLTNDGVFDTHLMKVQPDIVVHLAAQPGRVFGEAGPRHTIDSNLLMATLVARACGTAKTRLCYVSTSEVYGPSINGHSFVEDDECKPINLYGLTKLAAEHACRIYAPSNLLIIRPSMIYSGSMPVGEGRAALPTFIWNAMRGEPIEVHAGAERSWCYASDMARAMADVIERGEGIYNVGRDDDARSMREIAYKACRLAAVGTLDSVTTWSHQPIDQPSDLIRKLVREIEPPGIVSPVKRLSMSRLRKLGFEPEISLERGMTMTYETLRDEMMQS